MSLNSVMAVLQQALDKFQTSAMVNVDIAPIKCYIAPPQVVIDSVEGPEVYIWGGHAQIHRTTAPKTPYPFYTGGFKRAPWELDIWVFFVDAATPSDTNFPTILDAIRQAIESIPFPQQLTDINSNPPNTQLVEIGQNLRIEYPPPHSIEDQSNLLYTAHIVCDSKEDYTS